MPIVRTPVSPEPEDVLDALLAACRTAGHPVAASLWLEDAATATVRRVASRGDAPPAEDFERIADSELGSAVDTGAARFAQIERSGAGGGRVTVWRFAVPVGTGDAKGAVAIDLTGSEPDRHVLARVVAALRPSLSGALAMHLARVQIAAAKELTETAHDLARLLDSERVIEVALEHAIRLSGAQTGSIMLLGADSRLRITASRGLPESVVRSASVGEGEGIAGWVVASGQSVVVEDLEGRDPKSRRHGIRSAVSVPIADQDGLLGVLNVGNRRIMARFSRAHVEALETLGKLTALALRNALASESSSDLFFDSLRVLARAVEMRDPFTFGEADRVAEVAQVLAETLGFDEAEQSALRIASLLHDIGMDAAGEGVTTNRRALSTVEWGMVQLHPALAAQILENAPALHDVAPIVYHHHEHYDGSGYVNGVAGERIPLGARVLAVADAWVAMTSDRPYRMARSADSALSELEAGAGTQFDPLVVEAFLSAYADGRIPEPSAHWPR